MTLDELRRLAVARSLFAPTTLERAFDRLGFVQADPIRAPARAQDLILRQRVAGYRAGDLARRYAALGVEEDVFLNYGFVTRALHRLMHPRARSGVPAEAIRALPAARRKRAALLLDFVRARGSVHPRQVDEHFAHGTVTNYWGGRSSATTHLLEAMHYCGLLRVERRERGVRVYAAHVHDPRPGDAASRRAVLDRLVDVVAGLHAPLPGSSLSTYVRRLRHAVPHWRGDLGGALERARERLARVKVDGVDWYSPADEDAAPAEPRQTARLLAPFDPLVHDRSRFELLWGWQYRFEAYTPVPRRKLGYYALPLLWRDRIVGWANLAVRGGELECSFGYVDARPPRDRAFGAELEAEVSRVRSFLGLARW